MKLKTSAVILIASAILSGCSVNTPLIERLKLQSDGSYPSWKGDGVLYALPKRGFDIGFSLSKTSFGSPACDAATLSDEDKKLLGLEYTNPVIGTPTVFAIHSSTLSARSVPDASKVFIARFPEASDWADTSFQLDLNESGIISKLDGSASSKGAELAVKTLEFVGNLGAAVVAFAAASKDLDDDDKKNECNNKVTEFKNLADELRSYRVKVSPFPKETVEKYEQEIKAEQASIIALFTGKPSVTKGDALCLVAPQKAGATTVLKIYNEKGVFVPDGVECQIPEVFKVSADFSHDDSYKVIDISLKTEVPESILKKA